MSCPARLSDMVSAHRAGAEPQGWAELRAHLDDCDHCRRRAETLDPLLAFGRLPETEVDDDEVESMVGAVRIVTRARQRERSRTGQPGRWRTVAAAALLVVGVGLGVGGHGPADELAAITPTPPPAAPAPTPLPRELAMQPVFEQLDARYDPVVFADDELSIVFVVDERLDG